MSAPPRKIVHVDMDAFYASVEQRDRPELRGRPVVVGGDPRGRGVVATASYEARAFGVRSAMPAAQAYRLCPQAVFLPPDFERYHAASQVVHRLLEEVTDRIEPVSLDEAYLDVTENRLGEPSATRLARRLLERIREETGLTASAGVSATKFLAKVASDLRKPAGLVVIAPGEEGAVLAQLPVGKIPGVGPVTAERCRQLGLRTCGDLLRVPEEALIGWFGSAGPWFRDLARGIDPRPVEPWHDSKSVSVEDTFPRDLEEPEELRAAIARLAEVLAGRLREAQQRGRTVTLKVKFADFRQVTRRRTEPLPLAADPDALAARGLELLERTEAGRRPVRLLGLGVSGFAQDAQRYLPFYAELVAGGAG